MKPIQSICLLAIALSVWPGAFRVVAQENPPAEAPSAEMAAPAKQPGLEESDEPERPQGIRREAIIKVGKDAELKAGDTAEAVVVIGGSAEVHGRAREGVVVIGGNAVLDGLTRNVVTIGGDSNIRGKVRDSVVSILGNVNLE